MSHGHGAGGVGASSGYYTTGSEYGGYQNGVHSPQVRIGTGVLV